MYMYTQTRTQGADVEVCADGTLLVALEAQSTPA